MPIDNIDLRSVPNHRFFGKNDIIERLRRAVPFDYIFISGLDVDHYRFGNGFSIDTDLPPGYVEAYHADRLYAEDPFVAAAKAAKSVVVEHEVYAEHSPPQRLLYLQRTFGVHNRTLFPIARESVTYGAVGVTRATPFDDEELTFLSLVAETIHTVVTKPLMEKFAAEHLRLSKGEMACLSQASLGVNRRRNGALTHF
ncbi:autoinducer binding domain-containing protein [Agrobacterium pusense]|uniref:Autoinducer binding domain-containing protein n=1 Tax=Agrobacterium pusense TaxID=648995 RepID=A0AA44IXE0_9HYPH|nr:autoinducer binding domain-containing protein [Agrobacterium pusense]NRF07472.1 autoinducer binding domain-containing protein [Agrobacterium pusense]NRF18204.1 autoinducer binding domain-containing protein [Agrobacterium pusense]